MVKEFKVNDSRLKVGTNRHSSGYSASEPLELSDLRFEREGTLAGSWRGNGEQPTSPLPSPPSKGGEGEAAAGSRFLCAKIGFGEIFSMNRDSGSASSRRRLRGSCAQGVTRPIEVADLIVTVLIPPKR
jgi:hypothetical protein